MPRLRFWRSRLLRRRKKGGRGGLWPSLLLGLTLAFLLIRWFDAAIRPQLVALSEAQVKNRLIQISSQAVTRAMEERELSYRDMVSVQTSGEFSALTLDTAGLNSLRATLLEEIVAQVGAIDDASLGVPLGALTGIDLLSALGPRLPVRIISVAAVDGQYRNDFTAAGINQTLHRVMLDVTLHAKLLLPGGVVEIPVSAPVCVSETVIIGQVPQTYFSLNQ